MTYIVHTLSYKIFDLFVGLIDYRDFTRTGIPKNGETCYREIQKHQIFDKLQ